MAATVSTIFLDLYPNVMVSSTSAAYSLTVQNTASSSYALKVMTIVAMVFFPLVLLYQGWTYYVFRPARLQLGPSEAAGPRAARVAGAPPAPVAGH